MTTISDINKIMEDVSAAREEVRQLGVREEHDATKEGNYRLDTHKPPKTR